MKDFSVSPATRTFLSEFPPEFFGIMGFFLFSRVLSKRLRFLINKVSGKFVFLRQFYFKFRKVA